MRMRENENQRDSQRGKAAGKGVGERERRAGLAVAENRLCTDITLIRSLFLPLTHHNLTADSDSDSKWLLEPQNELVEMHTQTDSLAGIWHSTWIRSKSVYKSLCLGCSREGKDEKGKGKEEG